LGIFSEITFADYTNMSHRSGQSLSCQRQAIGKNETLRRYFGGLESAKNEDCIEATILTAAVNKQKQKQMTDFFNVVNKDGLLKSEHCTNMIET
jgi:hypothetical protein